MKLLVGRTRTAAVDAVVVMGYLTGVRVEVEAVRRDHGAVRGTPFGRLPVLCLPGGGSLPRTPAMLRYFSHLRADLGLEGCTLFEEAMVDTWLDVCRLSLETPVGVLDKAARTAVPAGVVQAAKAAVARVLACLEARLAHSRFAAGDDLSVADVLLVCSLARVWAVVGGDAPRDVRAWYSTCRAQGAFHAVLDAGAAAPPRVPGKAWKPCIVDCDPGVDDVMALFCICAAHLRGEVDLLGITIVMGNNNDTDLLARNACFVLDACGLSDKVVVVKGCDKPLVGEYHGHSGIEVHGTNGIGNVALPWEPSDVPLRHKFHTATEYLTTTCARLAGAVSVVALGPLTNVASAAQHDPAFGSNVKQLVLMGGTVDGKGNKAPHAEANIHNDPDAAAVVFQQLPDITMAGLNLTTQVPLAPLRARLEAVAPVGDFLFRISQHYVDLLTSWSNFNIPVHDSCAVMALLHPELFTGTRVHVDVEVVGKLTRGCTVADWLGHWDKPKNTLVLQTVDTATFHDTYMGYITELCGLPGVKSRKWASK